MLFNIAYSFFHFGNIKYETPILSTLVFISLGFLLYFGIMSDANEKQQEVCVTVGDGFGEN